MTRIHFYGLKSAMRIHFYGLKSVMRNDAIKIFTAPLIYPIGYNLSI